MKTIAASATLALAVAGGLAVAATPDPAAPAELVSRASGAAGEHANGDSIRPGISSDGRRVAFESTATNLVPDDTDPGPDVYLRDLGTDETLLVSRASGAIGSRGDGESVDPALSAGGGTVAFASTADNLDGTFPGPTLHIFARDIATGTTTAIDRQSGAGGAIANNDSGRPAISRDGRFVAFETAASNLDPADTDGLTDVYVRDRFTEATVLASPGADVPVSLPALSTDGARVAYRTAPPSNVTAAAGARGDLHVRDLVASTTSIVRTADVTGAPSISADGRLVAFSTNDSGFTDEASEVRVHDLASGRTERASRDLPAWGKREPSKSIDPALSPDGRYLAFSVQYGARGRRYRLSTVLRDLRRERSVRIAAATSRSTTEALPRGFGLVRPALARRATVLAFQSDSADRATGDLDALIDVFALRP